MRPPLADSHGKRPGRPAGTARCCSRCCSRSAHMFRCPIASVHFCAVGDVLTLTRYLDQEIVSSSSGAPCPLEETKVVCKGKVYSISTDHRARLRLFVDGCAFFNLTLKWNPFNSTVLHSSKQSWILSMSSPTTLSECFLLHNVSLSS